MVCYIAMRAFVDVWLHNDCEHNDNGFLSKDKNLCSCNKLDNPLLKFYKDTKIFLILYYCIL